MSSVIALEEIPLTHVFWPNDEVHEDGLRAMLDFVDGRKLKDDEEIFYYQKVRDPKLDWGRINYPNSGHYILAPFVISVGKLRSLGYHLTKTCDLPD